MRFGERFINLLNTDLGASGRGETADLAVALRAAELAVPSGPGTLYLGSTAFLAEDLVIDERFELLLSPSAKIIVLAGSTLTVLGPIDLERRHHFACQSGARVRLLGSLDAIYPEWWGTPHDIGLEAARRLAVDRISDGRPQVPIRLRGPYTLTSTFRVHANELTVEVAEPMSPSLVFEGEFPRGDQVLEPTFRHDPAAVGGFILVDVDPASLPSLQCTVEESRAGIRRTPLDAPTWRCPPDPFACCVPLRPVACRRPLEWSRAKDAHRAVRADRGPQSASGHQCT